MTCDRERIELFHDGELPDGEREAVRRHLAECPSCARVAADLDRLEEVLRSARLGGPPDEARFVARVRSRVRRRWAMALLGMAAVFLVGLTVWNIVEAVRPSPPSRPDPAAAVRRALERYAAARNERERTNAIAEIRRHGDEGVRSIVGALDAPSVRLQIAAAQVLTRLRDDKVRGLLLEHARRQRPPAREEERWSLEDPAVPPSVVQAMVAAERGNRAGRLLQILGGELEPEVADAVSEWTENLLLSPKAERKRLGLEILKSVAVQFRSSLVIRLLDSPEFAPSALEVLRKRSGRDFGTDREAWRKFFQEM